MAPLKENQKYPLLKQPLDNLRVHRFIFVHFTDLRGNHVVCKPPDYQQRLAHGALDESGWLHTRLLKHLLIIREGIQRVQQGWGRG